MVVGESAKAFRFVMFIEFDCWYENEYVNTDTVAGQADKGAGKGDLAADLCR